MKNIARKISSHNITIHENKKNLIKDLNRRQKLTVACTFLEINALSFNNFQRILAKPKPMEQSMACDAINNSAYVVTGSRPVAQSEEKVSHCS